jgi:hypothetical protein
MRITFQESRMSAHEPSASTVEIIVKLAPHATAGSAAHEAMLQCARNMGVALEPTIDTYHAALVPKEKATDALEQLRRCEGVEAAYAKPRGEPPNGGM